MGDGIGYIGLPGWSIKVDNYCNGPDPTCDDHVAFSFDGDSTNYVAWAPLPETEGNGWPLTEIEDAALQVTVSIDGTTYIDQVLSGYFDFPAYVGFTAGTGSLTNDHLILSLIVTEQLCEEQ